MTLVEPVPDEPAAMATVGTGRALLIADFHAGIEAGFRYERGLEIPSRAAERRDHLRDLLERTGVERLVVLGDLTHSIGEPGGAERGELEVLFEGLPPVDVTLVKGNHDGAIESWLDDGRDEPAADGSTRFSIDGGGGVTSLTVVPGHGGRIGDVGVCHGHSWPAPAVLAADVVCVGHEHPCVRLEDEVGGSRIERVWLRGRVDLSWFREHPRYEGIDLGNPDDPPTLVVVPAFNDLVGGTWVNVAGQSFLSPFLPEGITDAEAYLLDGTRLGPYESV